MKIRHSLILLSSLVLPLMGIESTTATSKAPQEITVTENLQQGSLLKLSNGSFYEVAPEDTDISSAWLLPFPIVIVESADPKYPLYLVNKDTGTRIKARLQSQDE